MESTFDRNITISQNFPALEKQSPSDINMLDSEIDITDKEMPIEIELFEKECKRFFYLDHHHVEIQLLHHFKELLANNLLIDEDGDTLDENSSKVKAFWNLEEVKQALQEQEIFDAFYEELTVFDKPKGENNGWEI